MKFVLLSRISVLIVLLQSIMWPVSGQERAVPFDVSAAGVTKSIPTWGLDTAWLSDVNVRRGVIFMGQPQVDVIRFSFTGDTTVSGGNLTGSGYTEFTNRMGIVNAYADGHTTLYLNNDTESLNAYYQGVSGVNATTWAQLINVTRSNCVAAGRTVVSVAPFNEPDFATYQGNTNRLADVCAQLRTTYAASFTGIRLYGGATLNNDQANTWYNPVNALGYLEEGCTHQLAGSFNNYAAFFQNVQTNGDVGSNDELHNVMEAMVGVEYGMGSGIWWGAAERARGEFVKTSDGQRLGYAEHRNNWSAASVYRGSNGVVQAFIGESERQAQPTTFRFFSKDRDVFYDGFGPQRAYEMTTTGGAGYQTAAHKNAEKVVNVTWGDNIQPAITNGRYIIVARHSVKAMTVENSSTNDGANILQYTYTNGLNQQWDVTALPSASGGDYSYFSITAAHSGKAPDVVNFSFGDGGDVRQYGLPGTYPGVNQQWFLEHVTNGWFSIRSRWSGKHLDVNGGAGATQDGANIHQWTGNNGLNQQWRLIPVGADPTDVTAPGQITGVNATANPRSVQLTWTASAAADLGGYTVLRSTNSGGPYQIVARGSTNNSFTDKFANENKTYYYVVRAVDKSWNSSVNSAQVSATPSSAPTLVARYAFDGNLNDSTVNANHPIVTNGSPGFTTGTNGSALLLNGTSQYTMLPANMLAGATNFTVAAWVYWSGGSAWQRIFDFGNDLNEYLMLTPSSGGGNMRFAITTNSYPSEQGVETTALPVNQWRHVAVTFNGTTLSIYTNGVLANSGAVSLSPAIFNPALNYLGRSQYTQYSESVNDPLFNGRLDDLYVYNYALSGAEIAQLVSPSNIAVWDGGGADNDWTSALNWVGDVAPLTSGNSVVFAGTTRLAPNMNNNYSVSSLTFSNNAGNFVIGTSTGSTLTSGNGGIANNSTSAQTLNVPVVLNGAQTISAAAGNLTVNSNLNAGSTAMTVAGVSNTTINGAVSGATTLAKNGAGTLSLNGGFTGAGNFSVNAGKVSLGGATTPNGDLFVGSGTGVSGAMDINAGGSVTMPSTWFFVGVNNGTGVMNVTGNGSMNVLRLFAGGAFFNDNGTGTVNIATSGSITGTDGIFIGEAWSNGRGSGTVNLTNGTVVSGTDLWIGGECQTGSTNQGTFNQYGGSVASSSYFLLGRGGNGGFAAGTYNLIGGIVHAATNANFTSIAGQAPSVGILNVSGGTFNSPGGMIVGEGWGGSGTAAGTLNVSNTGLVDLGTNGVNMAANAIATGTVNLNGGTLRSGSVFKGGGSATFNFNGGTLRASASSATFMQGLTAANVQAGGAIIDTTNNNSTIAQPLLAAGGGLTKNGTGTLTLNGASTYTGSTIINSGTLALGASGSIGSSSTIDVASGATFDVSANSFTLGGGQTLKGNGTVTGAATINGTVAPGASIGTLTFGTAPVMNGTALMEINRTNAPNADKLVLSSGTLTNGGTLTVTNIGGSLQAGDSFQLLSAPSYSGSFAVTNLPPLGSGLAWSNSLAVDGTISVVATVSLVPTNIVLSLNGTNLTLSWPESHKGWRLQGQTNGLTSTNWFDVPGSSLTNVVLVPVIPGDGTAFYRLVYP